jgi:hypothetical protein
MTEGLKTGRPGPALDGTDITSPTAMPAGGVGIRGWLSAIWTKLNGTISIIGYFKTGDSTYQVPRLDVLTRAQNVMEYAHHEIHGGFGFTAQYNITTAATAGHRSGLLIKTPETMPLVHVVVTFAVSVAARYSICEAPTIAANTGTHAVPIYNRYRDHANASGCFDNANAPAANKYTTLSEAQIAADATWSVGTIIRANPLISGSGPKPAGGSSRDTQEYILKANTKYVFLITNLTADANVHDITIDWYEHTNRAA